MTVCDDKAGTEASVKIAADWIKANAGTIGAAPPQVAEGDTILALN